MRKLTFRLFSGYTSEKAQDTEFQCKTIKGIAWVAAPTAAIFSIVNYYSGFFWLSVIELFSIILLLPLFSILQHQDSLPLYRNLLLANAFMTFISIFYFGGIGDSGSTWSMVMPFLAFLLVGLPKGWYWCLSYTAALIFMVTMHFAGMIEIPYDHNFLIFFPFTFIFFCLIAAILELQLERLYVKHEYLLDNLALTVAEKTEALQSINEKLKQKVAEHQNTIEALKQSEEKFEHAQRMESIGVLVGGISHDFNNMLTGILGNIFLAKKKLGDNPNISKHLLNIENLSKSASDMIRQLLTFSRKDEVSMKNFSITLFFSEAIKLARSAIPENIKVTQNIAKEDMIIQGDSTQIQQLIMNLINNARDAVNNRKKPEVTCKLELFQANAAFKEKHPELTAEKFALLSVSDNGHGIPYEIQDRIFEPFFTTKDANTGTGLGLAMLYGAVQRHHGIIELESEPDVGTTFHIYLPLIKSSESESQPSEIELVHGQGETILLVDDDNLLRSATSEVLQSLGYHIIEADDGEKAFEIYQEEKNNIDLLLTDLVMPNMGGFELTLAVRQLNKDLPVIFATGYDKDQSLNNEIHLDNSLIITKPFSFNELSQFIRIILVSADKS